WPIRPLRLLDAATPGRYRMTRMGRRRKAWLWGGDGVRREGGRELPGYYVRYSAFHGERRINRSKHFQTIRLARKWVRDFNLRLELGQAGQYVPCPLPEAVREYLEGGSSWAIETARQYGVSLGLFMDSAGPVRTTDLNARHIDTFLAERAAVGTRPATLAKHIRALRAFFNW